MDKIDEIKTQKLDTKLALEEKRRDEENEAFGQDWEIKIIPSTILCYVGKPVHLTAIGIYKNAIIHDLTREVSWKSKDVDIAFIDKEGMMIPSSAGKTNIRITWLGTISFETKCVVIPEIPAQEIQWLSDRVSKRQR